MPAQFARLLRARELRVWAFGALVADTMSYAMRRSYGADIEAHWYIGRYVLPGNVAKVILKPKALPYASEAPALDLTGDETSARPPRVQAPALTSERARPFENLKNLTPVGQLPLAGQRRTHGRKLLRLRRVDLRVGEARGSPQRPRSPPATIRRVYHLLSAGTTNHGACSCGWRIISS